MLLEEMAAVEAGIKQPLIDCILENLVEPKRTERASGYRLAKDLIARCSKAMMGPLHHFLQQCLPTTVTTSEAVEESEMRDEWRSLVVELAGISPDTVTYLLPQLEGVRERERAGERARACARARRVGALGGRRRASGSVRRARCASRG